MVIMALDEKEMSHAESLIPILGTLVAEVFGGVVGGGENFTQIPIPGTLAAEFLGPGTEN